MRNVPDGMGFSSAYLDALDAADERVRSMMWERAFTMYQTIRAQHVLRVSLEPQDVDNADAWWNLEEALISLRRKYYHAVRDDLCFDQSHVFWAQDRIYNR